MKLFPIPSLCLFLVWGNLTAGEKRYSFIVCGDPQYHAEKSVTPQALDPYSEEAMERFIRLAGSFSGKEIPPSLGGGKASTDLLGMIVTGDLIDSADKNGGPYPAMQRIEWDRYKVGRGVEEVTGRWVRNQFT